jgi:cell division transport system ATP-binding protein
MIRIQHVTKIFPNGVKALDDVTVQIDEHEFVFVVGSSGAGKSSLLKLLYRADQPTGGEVHIHRFNVGKLSKRQIPYLRRNMGIVFQDYKLLPRRTVYENIAFAMRVVGSPRHLIRRRVTQVLELVNLTSKASHLPGQLSGGEQQRICIARAIVNNPPILLADEPTGNLDPETSWEIFQLLLKINQRRTTVIVATHHKEVVDEFRKRVIALEGGKVVRDQQLGAYHYMELPAA